MNTQRSVKRPSRNDVEPQRKESEVTELFVHVFAGLVLGSTVAFVLAGTIVMCL